VNVRPATLEDAGAVADVFRSVEEAVLGRRSRFDANEVLAWWHGTSLATNTWVAEEDGELIAAAGGAVHGDRGVFAGAVRPSAQGRGLGSSLAGLAEDRLAAQDASRLHSWTVAGDVRAAALFSGRRYREVRRFWEMAIELDSEPPAPPVPVETFRGEDARAFHAALEESFAGHWEHHATPFEEWWELKRKAPDYDPTLWFVIRDGGEIVAVARNDPDRSGGGHIGALGVVAPWRGRGYGRALLLHSFREFRRRGVTRVGLGVDAANATGATRLYESVGMHVAVESVVYEKAVS
jgi:mycothiol synthase